MMKTILVFLALCCLAPAVEAKRLALVIGNNLYGNLPGRDLVKAENDADSMAQVLKQDLGFDVTLMKNTTWQQMNAGINALVNKAGREDVVFFYFSGHGVSFDSENYLLPSDVPLFFEDEKDRVPGYSFGVDQLQRKMTAKGVKSFFAIIDACRNNPFADDRGKAIGIASGLRGLNAAEGVFLLYAAASGQQALDRLSKTDPDPNSVFARALLPLLKKGGLSQVDLAKQVQADVVKLAASIGWKQTPSYYDQLLGYVVLKDAPQPAKADEQAFLAAGDDIALLQTVIDDFPGTTWAKRAQNKIALLKQPSGKPSAEAVNKEKVDVLQPDASMNAEGSDQRLQDVLKAANNKLKLAAAYDRLNSYDLERVKSEPAVAGLVERARVAANEVNQLRLTDEELTGTLLTSLFTKAIAVVPENMIGKTTLQVTQALCQERRENRAKLPAAFQTDNTDILQHCAMVESAMPAEALLLDPSIISTHVKLANAAAQLPANAVPFLTPDAQKALAKASENEAVRLQDVMTSMKDLTFDDLERVLGAMRWVANEPLMSPHEDKSVEGLRYLDICVMIQFPLPAVAISAEQLERLRTLCAPVETFAGPLEDSDEREGPSGSFDLGNTKVYFKGRPDYFTFVKYANVRSIDSNEELQGIVTTPLQLIPVKVEERYSTEIGKYAPFRGALKEAKEGARTLKLPVYRHPECMGPFEPQADIKAGLIVVPSKENMGHCLFIRDGEPHYVRTFDLARILLAAAQP